MQLQRRLTIRLETRPPNLEGESQIAMRGLFKSEVIGNLSKVLIERKKMKAKIQTMPMGTKAPASIVAALWPAVAALIYITGPQYIEPL